MLSLFKALCHIKVFLLRLRNSLSFILNNIKFALSIISDVIYNTEIESSYIVIFSAASEMTAIIDDFHT